VNAAALTVYQAAAERGLSHKDLAALIELYPAQVD
jgi:hypothetical protein